MTVGIHPPWLRVFEKVHPQIAYQRQMFIILLGFLCVSCLSALLFLFPAVESEVINLRLFFIFYIRLQCYKFSTKYCFSSSNFFVLHIYFYSFKMLSDLCFDFFFDSWII